MKYNNNHPIIQEICKAIYESGNTFYFCWVPAHIDIELNEEADVAARNATQNQIVENIRLPRSDIKCQIKRRSKERWKEEWCAIPVNANKLRNIKDNLTPYKYCYFKNRFWERTLCRLRIGHTHLTHQYLINRGDRPICETCLVHLTIHHIITECPAFHNERMAAGINNTDLHIVMDDLSYFGGPLHRFIINSNLSNKL